MKEKQRAAKRREMQKDGEINSNDEEEKWEDCDDREKEEQP